MVQQACHEQPFILREPPACPERRSILRQAQDERVVEVLTTNGLQHIEIIYLAVHLEPVEGRMANCDTVYDGGKRSVRGGFVEA